MNKLFYSLFFCLCVTFCGNVFGATDFSCGDGYVLVAQSKKVDGLNTMKCEKLWCRDLETDNGDKMGDGNTPASGYTGEMDVLTDNDGNSITCFGKRKWCSGEKEGEWNPYYGLYTRGNEEPGTYKSYKKGGCFAWRLEKPTCDAGETAILIDGKWSCRTQSGASNSRASTIRRTGSVRIQ